MKIYIYIIGFLSLLFTGCSGDDNPVAGSTDNEKIILSFQINSFVKGSLKAATDNGSAAEQTIDNLYVFLFPTSGAQTFKSYYIPSASFSGGSWNSIPLIRAVAKVQLNISLTAKHQEKPLSGEGTTRYKYRLIDFDKNTYVLKQILKTDNLVSSLAWINWNDAITSYTLDGNGKVTNLTLITYLNERDNAGTSIELSLPYFDGGFLPPPEFGDETYKLQLPAKIERNNWYVYDVEI